MQYHRKKNTSPEKAKKPSNSTTKAWIWGTHACHAALNNPKRVVSEVLASRNAYAQLPKFAIKLAGQPCEPARISAQLPTGAVHQGIAIATAPLTTVSLQQILPKLTGPLVMLDGITDPRNIGAIFRSAAAFGASAIIAQDRHMPPFTGVLAKAAAGAIETVPFVPVVNLSRTLEQLANADIQSIGLAGETKLLLSQATDTRPVCLVMGAEGKGIRPNVRKHCETLAKIPMSANMESLNVASAASVALYELVRG